MSTKRQRAIFLKKSDLGTKIVLIIIEFLIQILNYLYNRTEIEIKMNASLSSTKTEGR